MAIKEASRVHIIDDGDDWIDMLEDRNKTSHLYDESEARNIYEKIKKKHFPLLKKFSEQVLTSKKK